MERRTARARTHVLRASDADRDRVLELLADAAADGRLTLEEHAARLSRAQAARTLGDLASLTADLAVPADQPIRLDGGRSATAMMGRERRGGRWVMADGFTATAILGELDLDLTEAVLQRQHLLVRAAAVCGSVRMLVPDGVRVEVARTSPYRRQPARVLLPGHPGGPVIEIRAFCALGDVRAVTPRRRGWLAGLGFGRRGSGFRWRG